MSTIPGRRSIFSNSRYLDVTYSRKTAPLSEYPFLLAEYIHTHLFFQPGSLLDVGCGRGDYLRAFSHLNYKVQGIDLSPKAADLGGEYPVHSCNLESDPFPCRKGEYDYVFCKSVLEHLHHPDVVMQNIFEALQPGGKAVILTPSWSDTYWGPFYIDHTHVTPFTPVSLHNLLEISGFENVQVKRFIQLPLVWDYPWLRLFTWMVARLPLPYRPYLDAPWPERINKTIRFSKEIMLFASCNKPDTI